MRSNRVKRLASDIASFMLSGASIKLLSFFMMPLYTSYLTTEDYAVADLVSLGIQLAIPMLTLSISDSVLRFGLERSSDRDQVLGVGMEVTLFGSVVAIPICLIIGTVSNDFWIACFSFLLFLMQSINNYFSAYFKCLNKTKVMAAISAVSGTAVIVFNVLFIAVMGMGLHGYWLGNVSGNFVGLILYLSLGGWRVFRLLKKPEKCMLIQLLSYSLPLIPNSLFWWINSSMDRFVLTALSTLSFVGLYSVASKIPQILSTISSFFFQAWTISVFQDFGSADSANFFQKGFRLLSFGIYLIAGILIIVNVPLSKMLFTGEFFEAWSLVPLLLVGTSVSILNQFLGSVFTASKETKAIFSTTAIGSIVNIVLNFVLVILIGGLGAVIATLISYVLVYIIRFIKIKQSYPFINLERVTPCFEIIGLVVLSFISMSGAGVLELGLSFAFMTFLMVVVSRISERNTNELLSRDS